MMLAFGLRAYVQRRRTGSYGIRLFASQGRERLAALFLALAMLAWTLTPVAAILSWSPPIVALDTPAVHLIGVLIAGLGIAATLWAQFQMGASWRVGVDPNERTQLVTHGPYRLVRNPIYTAVLIFGVGEVLMVPSPFAIVAFLWLILALELQVRKIEEPYLLSVHGDTFRAWAEQVGRFVPGVGKFERVSG
jgi:protein-S-isoprenylcysteine O-methyltransferase Ste14